MHSYAETFEQPEQIEHDGKKLTVPLLTQRDYLPWCGEVAEKKRERARKAAPPAVKVNERARWLEYAEGIEATPQDIRPLVLTADGTIRVLRMAYAKAGLKDEASADALIDSKGAKFNEMMAVKLSGLFRREEFAELYPEPRQLADVEKLDPNALQALRGLIAEAVRDALSASGLQAA
jgi:hypothetical protein